MLGMGALGAMAQSSTCVNQGGTLLALASQGCAKGHCTTRGSDAIGVQGPSTGCNWVAVLSTRAARNAPAKAGACTRSQGWQVTYTYYDTPGQFPIAGTPPPYVAFTDEQSGTFFATYCGGASSCN